MSNLLRELDEDCEQINHPEGMNIQLKLHQLTSIYKMNYLENNHLIINNMNDILNSKEEYDNVMNYDNFDINILNTNIGILSDKVGAGKTYTILGLICNNKYIKHKNNYNLESIKTVSICAKKHLGHQSYYSHSSIQKSSVTYDLTNYTPINLLTSHIPNSDEYININTNLIIVPFGLFKQWSTSIANTNLKSYEINTRPKIAALHEDNLNNYDIILVTNTMYSTFLKKFEFYIFNRKIIDEANTISLPQLSYNDIIHSKFTWLITATPEYFNRRGGRQKRDIIGKLPYEFMTDISYYTYYNTHNSPQNIRSNYFIVRNKANFIDASIILPDILYYSHICPTPKELSVVKDYLEPELVSMLNAGNYKDALTVLGCDVGDSDNIFNVLTNNIKKSINETKAKIETYQISITTEELEPEQVYYMRRQIKEKSESLKSLETKYNSLNERITQFYKENCVICMDELEYGNYPSVTPCCNQLICFDCLIDMKKTQKVLKCPYCRNVIELKDICVLSNQKDEEIKEEDNNKEKKIKMRKYNKLDILTKILSENPTGKYLIFSEHDESFTKIIELLKTLNVTYREMKGNGLVINKIIENFNNNKIPVLLLNTRHMGAGLNLQNCSDIILFHRQRADLEKQLIGRGQRLGRTESLKVHYLLHDNEQYLEQSTKFEYNEIEDN